MFWPGKDFLLMKRSRQTDDATSFFYYRVQYIYQKFISPTSATSLLLCFPGLEYWRSQSQPLISKKKLSSQAILKVSVNSHRQQKENRYLNFINLISKYLSLNFGKLLLKMPKTKQNTKNNDDS